MISVGSVVQVHPGPPIKREEKRSRNKPSKKSSIRSLIVDNDHGGSDRGPGPNEAKELSEANDFVFIELKASIECTKST